jgi:hypothetical protein
VCRRALRRGSEERLESRKDILLDISQRAIDEHNYGLLAPGPTVIQRYATFAIPLHLPVVFDREISEAKARDFLIVVSHTLAIHTGVTRT